jgi:hypothetical protein
MRPKIQVSLTWLEQELVWTLVGMSCHKSKTILYGDNRFYWWKKSQYQELVGAIGLSEVTDNIIWWQSVLLVKEISVPGGSWWRAFLHHGLWHIICYNLLLFDDRTLNDSVLVSYGYSVKIIISKELYMINIVCDLWQADCINITLREVSHYCIILGLG